jgi:hypothetical protein
MSLAISEAWEFWEECRLTNFSREFANLIISISTFYKS